MDVGLIVTCGLTACTVGSGPGPMLGNEYGKPLPLILDNDGDALCMACATSTPFIVNSV